MSEQRDKNIQQLIKNNPGYSRYMVEKKWVYFWI